MTAALLAALLASFAGASGDDAIPNEQFDQLIEEEKRQIVQEHPKHERSIANYFRRVHDAIHTPQHQYEKTLPGPPSRSYLGHVREWVDAAYDALQAKASGDRAQWDAAIARHSKVTEIMAKSAEYQPYFQAFMKEPRGQGMANLPPEVRRDHGRRLIENNPGKPFPHIYDGNAKLADKKPAEAKAAANNAIMLDPKSYEGYSLRAAAEMDLKNYQAARDDARKALELNPNDERSKAVLALAHDTYGQGYKPSLGQPQHSQAPDAAAGGYGAGLRRAEAATASLAPTVSQGQLQADVLARQAQRAIGLGDHGAAIGQATRALDLDAMNASAYAARALAQYRAGRLDESLADAEKALELDPDNAQAHEAKMRALNAAGRYNDALAASREALESNPNSGLAHYMRAMAFNGLGDRAGTIAELEQAARLDRRYADAAQFAREAPAERDLSFLFPEENLAAARKLLGKRAAPDRGARLKVLLMTLLGGGLVLGGVLHVMWPAISRPFKNLTRRGPAVGTHATVAGLAIPGPLTLAGTGVVLGGKYQRLGQIGASVMGTVYEGKDLALDRPVVIRKMRAEMRAADRDRLLLPAKQAAALNHPGIASIYAVLDEPDALYLVSEFARGRSLRDALAARGPLPAEEALPLFRRAGEALDYAHRRGICHGALRASNFVVAADGSVKLLDFGLARGPADVASDLQAFAACLREAVAGLPPAKLDAVDAALTAERGRFRDAAHVVATVDGVLQSSPS